MAGYMLLKIVFTWSCVLTWTNGNLVSFKPVGEYIAFDLRLEAPFINIATSKSQLDSNQAFVNINSAALISSAVLTGSALLTGLFFKNLQQATQDERQQRHRILDYVKLRGSNSTAAHFDLSMPQLLQLVEQRFDQRDINIGACIRKSICTILQDNTYMDESSWGLHEVISGFLNTNWLLGMLQNASLQQVIDASRNKSCELNFPLCKLAQPEVQITRLITDAVNFV